ncbi:hypothetical protein GCM10023116_30990 [Kistimonas scapharcae]|uniref:Uncharacterized protein n=1 Tax=Kistimonas scapharcae TaxID=1036133 RepID=A0ABP8V4G5_9GAMM
MNHNTLINRLTDAVTAALELDSSAAEALHRSKVSLALAATLKEAEPFEVAMLAVDSLHAMGMSGLPIAVQAEGDEPVGLVFVHRGEDTGHYVEAIRCTEQMLDAEEEVA